MVVAIKLKGKRETLVDFPDEIVSSGRIDLPAFNAKANSLRYVVGKVSDDKYVIRGRVRLDFVGWEERGHDVLPVFKEVA